MTNTVSWVQRCTSNYPFTFITFYPLVLNNYITLAPVSFLDHMYMCVCLCTCIYITSYISMCVFKYIHTNINIYKMLCKLSMALEKLMPICKILIFNNRFQEKLPGVYTPLYDIK